VGARDVLSHRRLRARINLEGPIYGGSLASLVSPAGMDYRAHPNHESCTHRCADQRFSRSPPTIDRQVMCSTRAAGDVGIYQHPTLRP
jgi:hypothetical protein